MSEKRMRIFAGPNGSGKTTIINNLKSKKLFNFGVYVNADDIENNIENTSSLSLKEYKIETSTDEIQNYFKTSNFSSVKLDDSNLWKHLKVSNDCIAIDLPKEYSSYIAADIAAFIRKKLIEKHIAFSFETVMSHKSKLDLLLQAKENGYRIYLYFIATEDPEININRVTIRIKQDGHSVSPDIIKSRYYRCLENLKDAVILTDRAYLFDNSGKASIFIAEITNGKSVNVIDPAFIPNWVRKYLFNKI